MNPARPETGSLARLRRAQLGNYQQTEQFSCRGKQSPTVRNTHPC
jgi:hypothetical protein